MAEYGAAGGFSAGLQGGLDAGARLNANSLAARDAKVKTALTLRGLQIDEMKVKAEAKSKEQAKAATLADELFSQLSQAFAEGTPEKMAAAMEQINKLTSRPVLPNGRQAPSLADEWDKAAGRPVGYLAERLTMLPKVTPGMADKAAAAGQTAGAETTARTEAELALAPRVAAAAANQAAAVTTAQGQADVEVATRNRDAIAANAAATASAEAAAREGAATPAIVKLQRERADALARGDTRGAAEIDAQIQSLGASPAYDPRSAGQLSRTEIRKAAQDLTGTLQSMSEAANVQKMFVDAPQAAGALGATIETAGGLLGQLGTLVGLDLVPGAVNEVTAARTQARLFVDSMLRAIGQSERASNQDRQRAEAILRALRPDADVNAVYVAMQQTIDLMRREAVAAADQLLAGVDVIQNENVAEAGRILAANGVPKSQHRDIILALRERRR